MQAHQQTPPPNEVSFARADNSTLVVQLAGDWHLRHGLPSTDLVEKQLDTAPKPTRLTFEAAELRDWDSGLLTFLLGISEICHKRKLTADWSPLPEGVRSLIQLAEAVPEKTGARAEVTHTSFIEELGHEAISWAQGLDDFLRFLGEVAISFVRLATGKARFRRVDLMIVIQDCGASAFGIVTLVTFLVGVILAFMGAVQLQQFGAAIYVADLVGIAMSRDMGAMMTAIIMAGRTGAAFAAQLGSMKVTQEIDALTTMGISPLEFLVLPRVLALFLMIPLLCIYADCLGVAGGAFVSATMLHITVRTYIQETVAAVTLARYFRRRLQGRHLRHHHRGRRMPARISMRRQLVCGRRRGDRSGRHRHRVRNRRLRNFRLHLQHPRNLMAITHPSIKASDGKPVSVAIFPKDGPPPITVKNLTMAYGTYVIMKDINFTVKHGDIFIIMGGSGSGKSTLLRHMLGLIVPAKGEILYGDFNFTKGEPEQREEMLRHFGVLYQGGALWSSMTLAENVGLPLGEFTDLSDEEIHEVAVAQAGSRRAQGLRGLLSEPDQRRDAEARRIGARDRARSGNSFLRRAVGRPRSDQLAPARRLDPRAARQPRRHHRGRDARAGQHFCNRQQQHFSRPRKQDRDRAAATRRNSSRIAKITACRLS